MKEITSDTDIGGLIRSIRIQRGMSQDALADTIGTTRTAVAQIERGNNNPRLENLIKIFEELGVHIYIEADVE